MNGFVFSYPSNLKQLHPPPPKLINGEISQPMRNSSLVEKLGKGDFNKLGFNKLFSCLFIEFLL